MTVKKFSLLSVSLLIVSAGAIAANIPAIQKTYPKVPAVLIELLTTLPSLFIVLTILISQRVARKIGYKRTVQLGLLLVVTAGCLPFFIRSFPILLLSRLAFGVGVGLFNPLLFTFASKLYKGPELAAVIGFQSGFEGIGGMLMTFSVGQLLKISWETSFLAYLIGLPTLVLFSLFVPDIVGAATPKIKKTDVPQPFDWRLSKYILLLLITVTMYMSVAVKVTALLLEKGIGSPTDGSNLLALVGFGAMAAGLLFGRVVLRTKAKTLPFSILLLGVSLLLLSLATDLWLISAAVILCGFSFRTLVPYLFNEMNQQGEHGERNTAVLLIAFNMGSALAPLSIAALQSLVRLENNAGIFLLEGLLLFGLTGGVWVVSYLKRIRVNKREEQA